MNHPSIDVLKAMVELENNRDWNAIRAWFVESKAALDATWQNQTDDAEHHRMQGDARQLREIITVVEEAADRYEVARLRAADNEALTRGDSPVGYVE